MHAIGQVVDEPGLRHGEQLINHLPQALDIPRYLAKRGVDFRDQFDAGPFRFRPGCFRRFVQQRDQRDRPPFERQRPGLGLRQIDLAGIGNTGNRLIVDIEKGKPTVQLQKVLDVLDLLGLEVVLRPKSAGPL